MLATLILKELRVIVTGPKFVATFAACSFLLLLSVYIGINEYKENVNQYHAAQQLSEERLRQVSSWHNVATRVDRAPNPMQIFSSGLHYDIGRWSPIDENETVKLRDSIYGDDPIFALFRILDFTMIVQIVFSLFALLFTFDAVNGERENGTLRLIFANAVPRGQYLLAKAIGSWLGLVVPLTIPILICLLLVQAFGVPLTGSQWARVVTLIGISLTYVTLFVIIGVLVSTLTRRSSTSFMLALVFWIGFVLIIPRVGVMAAGHLSPVPRLAQVDGLRDGYAQAKWEEYYRAAEERYQDSRADDNGQIDEDALWARMEREDSIRSEFQRDIDRFDARLKEDLDNRRRAQQAIGFTLARMSPAAVYQLAMMTVAGNDLALKNRYEDALSDYRSGFLDYVADKSGSAGPGAGSVMITVDSENGLTVTSGRDNSGVDVSDMPRFSAPDVSLGSSVKSVMIDAGLLVLFTLVAFGAAFVSFLRFDVR